MIGYKLETSLTSIRPLRFSSHSALDPLDNVIPHRPFKTPKRTVIKAVSGHISFTVHSLEGQTRDLFDGFQIKKVDASKSDVGCSVQIKKKGEVDRLSRSVLLVVSSP